MAQLPLLLSFDGDQTEVIKLNSHRIGNKGQQPPSPPRTARARVEWPFATSSH